MPHLKWRKHKTFGTVWYMVKRGPVEVSLEPRPPYCDRGNWIAKVFPIGETDLDHQDGWPRYYMNFIRAQQEVEDWLRKRFPIQGNNDADPF